MTTIEETKSIETPVKKRRNWGALLAWVALFGLLGIVAMGMVSKQAPPVAIGKMVPDFSLTTFEGSQIHLNDLSGKVVVINFWASWCKPCEQEAADLEAAWRYYQPRGDVVFLGIAWTDTESASKAYLAKFDITYPNGPDVQTLISQAYHITGVPETYFIGKDGKVLTGKDANGRAYGNWIGPINKAGLEERIELLLKQ